MVGWAKRSAHCGCIQRHPKCLSKSYRIYAGALKRSSDYEKKNDDEKTKNGKKNDDDDTKNWKKNDDGETRLRNK
ncbi:hypothetical protein N7535_007293 [Penicillium sp. DV-2018c]|nr:hypothetical protein N7535_007293 [Penicillium sp. DV-2018c]